MKIDKNDYGKLYDIILDSNNIVFFGGAGVSTDSGLPDFRSSTGLYNKQNETGYSPEYMLSHEFLIEHPEEFSKYYKENLIFEDAKPNITHNVLAELEKMDKLKAIVTQNIDSLHQKADSKNVLEIHGNLRDFYCMECGKTYEEKEIVSTPGANYCECGGFIRPDVTLYGEGLNDDVVMTAVNAIANADVLIMGGTSLAVYPAAGFVNYYRGKKCILVNRSASGNDGIADYLVHDSLGNFFKGLDQRIKSI